MSVDHKRPLFAFVIVAIACAVIVANGIRSEAFVAMMRIGASHIVAGIVLEPARDQPQRPSPTAASEPVHEGRAAAVPQAPPASRSSVSRSPRRSSSSHASAGRAHGWGHGRADHHRRHQGRADRAREGHHDRGQKGHHEWAHEGHGRKH